MRSPWTAFLVRRLVALCLVLAGVVFASFAMVRLIPGDPVLNVIGFANVLPPEEIAQIRAKLGIDRPFLEQLVVYGGNLLQGDLGKSFALGGRDVSSLIAQRVGPSLQLAGAALTLVLLLSVPLGILVGAYTREGRHRRFEVAFTAVSSVTGAIPEYLMATFLAYVFAVWLRLLPVAGDTGLPSLVLPAVAIGLRPMIIVARIVRVETLNVLATDYMRTARSKWLPARLIYLRHVMPNVVTAALAIGGQLFSGIIGGAVIVENIFNRPGLGSTLIDAVHANDYPVTQAIVLVLGFTVVVANAAADISVALVNPRSLAGQA